MFVYKIWSRDNIFWPCSDVHYFSQNLPLFQYNHDFDWKHKKVLDFEKNWKTRTIKESIYSEENEHHINGISFKLPNIWKPILRENKAKKTTAFRTLPIVSRAMNVEESNTGLMFTTGLCQLSGKVK